MTTLQRSSVSFRRQGSSGRIWNDRHIIDLKTGLPHANAAAIAADAETGFHEESLPSFRSPDGLFSPGHEEIHHHDDHPQPAINNFESPPKPENTSAPPPAHTKHKPENHHSPHKVQRCGISGLFGRCIGPPTD